jgi:hypothetical protein
MSIWKYIKADSLFKDFLPEIKGHKHKIRGKNGRGNPVDFSEDEKKEINKTIDKIIKEYKL